MRNLTPAPSLSKKIIRNTIFNSAGQFWSMFVTLLLTPYIISVLGVRGFGIWSLSLALTGYIGLLDVGVSTSLVKYISEYDTKGDLDAINRVVNTGFVFYLALAAIILPLTVLFADRVLHFFHIPAEIWHETRFVLIAAAAIYCLSNTFGVFEAVMAGLQRMDVTNAIAIATSIPNAVGTVAFLQLGYGLRGLAVNQVLVFALTTILTTIYAFRLLPQLRFNPLLFSTGTVRSLAGYGAKVQLTKLGARANLRVNNVLVGYFLGVEWVAFYELGFKVAYTTLSVPRLLASAIMPAASELQARKDNRTLRELYGRSSKYLALVAAPVALFVILDAHPIMSAWMGPGYARSALAIRLLTVGYFVNLVATGAGTAIARGIGKPGYETRYAVVVLLVHVVLAVTLLAQIGFVGVLAATLIAAVLGSAYFVHLFHGHLREPFGQFAKQTYTKPLVACLVAGCVLYAVRFFTDSFALPSNRLVTLALLTVNACAFGGTYLIVILKSGFLDAYDREVLARTKSLVPFSTRSRGM